jgi:hypothetical protein
MEIIITMLWSIWELRNDVIFRNIAPSITNCRRIDLQKGICLDYYSSKKQATILSLING